VDLDLGNYERFLDITLHRDNNITTGKIYRLVIDKERTGEYLGKTVQGKFSFFFVFRNKLPITESFFHCSCTTHHRCHTGMG